MSDISTLLSDLLGSIPTNAVLRERIEFIKDQLAAEDKARSEAFKTIERLLQENDQLRKRCDELEKQVAAHAVTDQYTEHRGALFKKDRSKIGHHIAVYCPKCKSSAAPFPPGEAFSCECGWFSAFNEAELEGVLKEISPPKVKFKRFV
ncbi:MAG: hypothetical protein FWC38_00820 [Proteobacteria bacterium]|nr:hypothetical protein [Pseudomonadota bacterium]MCL2306785.1 hypothetical protein [Pseudomonadota bacterium]